MSYSKWIFSVSIFLLAFHSKATEPTWCNPNTFDQYRIYSKVDDRIHVFKIGKLTLAGMPVGTMEVDDVIDVAFKFSKSDEEDKYCTWYLHKTNPEAAENFHHTPLPAPLNPFDG